MKNHSQRGGPFKPPKKKRRRNMPIQAERALSILTRAATSDVRREMLR